MVKWQIFYESDTFSNAEGDPQDAPGGGVQAVAQQDDEAGVVIHHGSDFYVFDEKYGGWYGLDHFGLVQYILVPGSKIIKLAESMTTEKYLSLLKRIRENPNLPSKSAHYPWEVHV